MGGARGVHDRQLLRSKQRLQRRKARMQSEKSIQINRRISRAAPRLRNRNRRPQPVIILLGEGNYDVQPIRRPALKQHHKLLLVRHRSRRCRALQKRRHRAQPDQSNPALLQKIPPRKLQSSRAFATFVTHVAPLLECGGLAAAFTVDASPRRKPKCTAALAIGRVILRAALWPEEPQRKSFFQAYSACELSTFDFQLSTVDYLLLNSGAPNTNPA